MGLLTLVFTGRAWGGEEVVHRYDGVAWRGAALGRTGIEIGGLCSGPRPRAMRLDPRLYRNDPAGWDAATGAQP